MWNFKLKITISEMKNSLDGINIKLQIREEKSSEHEDLAIDLSKMRHGKEKRLKKFTITMIRRQY